MRWSARSTESNCNSWSNNNNRLPWQKPQRELDTKRNGHNGGNKSDKSLLVETVELTKRQKSVVCNSVIFFDYGKTRIILSAFERRVNPKPFGRDVIKKRVAIKIMDINEIKEEYVVRNLYREAKIMSKLSHPCIATLFQTMQHGNMYYLVTELVSGGDLCNYIRGQRNGKLEEHCTRAFARQLISAISHMHNLGIVHRDLKMENVMLCPTNDRIKIVDFGLSNLYNGDKLLRTHCGSPEYAAPELFVEGKQYGPEVDLWSLGVILYGMVVGQLPFVSNTRDGAAVSQRRKKLLEQINKGLSSTHRKSLALFSIEFKAMMGKLLVADSSKRINITELIFHPWVTEKGRKSIRSNRLKKLDEHSKFSIIKDVSTLINANWEDVQHAVQVDPHGNVAGMYNLLEHRAMQNSLEGDLVITKTGTAHYATPRPQPNKVVAAENAKYSNKLKSPVGKRQDTIKSAPPQKALYTTAKKPESAKASAYTSKNCDTTRCSGDDSVRKSLAAKRPIMVNDNSLKIRKGNGQHPDPESQCSCTSVLETSNKTQADSKSCQTPMPSILRTLTKSAATKHADVSKGPITPHIRSNLTRSPGGDALSKENTKCLFDEFLYNSVPAHNTRSKKSKIEAIMQQAFPPLSLKKTHRTLSASLKPSENRLSNPVSGEHSNRPLTTGITTITRSVKRRSMLPVLQMNKTATSTSTGVRKSAPAKSRLQHHSSKGIDRSEEGKRHNNSAINRKIDLSNEPIARSIAGYMTRNINSNKMDSMKWIKGASANLGT